jgi:TonB family protein
MADYKNDIEKYLRGELTPAQMHALEKKALDDPFLADALEGAQQLQPESFLEDVSQLQQSIHSRIKKKNTSPWLHGWRIAAGLLLLAVSAYLIIFIANRSDKATENLALTEKQELVQPSAEKDASSAGDSLREDRFGLTPLEGRDDVAGPVKEEQKKKQDASATTPVESRPESHEPAGPLAEAPQEIAETEVAADELAISKEVEETLQATKPQEKITNAIPTDVLPPPVVSRDEEQSRQKALRSATQAPADDGVAGKADKTASDAYSLNRRVVRGKVTFSDDGTGLPGVNVMVTGTNEGTVTDVAGNYEIPVGQGHPTLSFSFIGFTSKEVEVTSEQVDVQLDADVSELSEVVVVGYGEKSLGDLSAGPTVMELAAPAGGRKAFKQYLEQNVRYPEQALKNKVEGKVTIQFSVGMTGQVSDFKVIRGIGYGCDEEVIRLIKAGPKWSPTKKNDEPMRDRVRVRMRFSLPKK